MQFALVRLKVLCQNLISPFIVYINLAHTQLLYLNTKVLLMVLLGDSQFLWSKPLGRLTCVIPLWLKIFLFWVTTDLKILFDFIHPWKSLYDIINHLSWLFLQFSCKGPLNIWLDWLNCCLSWQFFVCLLLKIKQFIQKRYTELQFRQRLS